MKVLKFNDRGEQSMKLKSTMLWSVPALCLTALIMAGCSSESMMKDDSMDKQMMKSESMDNSMMNDTMEHDKSMQEPMMDKAMDKSMDDSMMDSGM
jgi:hypothetical protein